MPISATVVCDSTNGKGNRLTSLVVEFPKPYLAELNKHRVLSNSFMSSRAVPVPEMIKRVQEDPYIPYHWGKKQKGMEAEEECDNHVGLYDEVSNITHFTSKEIAWVDASRKAIQSAKEFHEAGYHKQIVNRILEPYSYTVGVLTGTEWENFFTLRDHKAAQPEFRLLAQAIRKAMKDSVPFELEPGEFHLPFVTDQDELTLYGMPSGGEGNLEWIGNTLPKLSVARNARISYASNQRGKEFTIEEDLALYSRLFGPPLHAGPFEHPQTPMRYPTVQSLPKGLGWEKGITHVDREGNFWSGNSKGFIQYRYLI